MNMNKKGICKECGKKVNGRRTMCDDCDYLVLEVPRRRKKNETY